MSYQAHQTVNQFVPNYVVKSDYLPTRVVDGNQSQTNQWVRPLLSRSTNTKRRSAEDASSPSAPPSSTPRATHPTASTRLCASTSLSTSSTSAASPGDDLFTSVSSNLYGHPNPIPLSAPQRTTRYSSIPPIVFLHTDSHQQASRIRLRIWNSNVLSKSLINSTPPIRGHLRHGTVTGEGVVQALLVLARRLEARGSVQSFCWPGAVADGPLQGLCFHRWTALHPGRHVHWVGVLLYLMRVGLWHLLLDARGLQFRLLGRDGVLFGEVGVIQDLSHGRSLGWRHSQDDLDQTDLLLG